VTRRYSHHVISWPDFELPRDIRNSAWPATLSNAPPNTDSERHRSSTRCPGTWGSRAGQAERASAQRIELGIPVVPVLLGVRFRMRAEDLPERIQQVADLQCLFVRADRPEEVDAGVERLLEVL
jgi:hypothetical protein